MNDKELIKRARMCSGVDEVCDGCPFAEKEPHDDWCVNGLLAALAERLEALNGE